MWVEKAFWEVKGQWCCGTVIGSMSSLLCQSDVPQIPLGLFGISEHPLRYTDGHGKLDPCTGLWVKTVLGYKSIFKTQSLLPLSLFQRWSEKKEPHRELERSATHKCPSSSMPGDPAHHSGSQSEWKEGQARKHPLLQRLSFLRFGLICTSPSPPAMSQSKGAKCFSLYLKLAH